MKRSACGVVATAAFILTSVFGNAGALAGNAAVYDAVNDFNSTGGTQTLGATWTYGSETSLNGAGFSLIPNFNSLVCNSTDNTCTPTGATQLVYSTNGAYRDPYPSLIKNASTGTITYAVGSLANGVGVNSTVVFPNNVLAFGPAGNIQVLRFTVPTDGLYNIGGYFVDLQAASVGLDIVINGETLEFQDLTSFTGATTLQGSVPFSFSKIRLLAKDTVDLVVDGTFPGGTNDDIVGASATVTKVSDLFAGTPGQINCQGQSVAALTLRYGSLLSAAKALSYSSAQALQVAIKNFCVA
jgi:hypothetical protein